MTQKTKVLPTWFAKDEERAKARLLAQAKQLDRDVTSCLDALFKEQGHSLWLMALVDFYHTTMNHHLDLSILFREWPEQSQQAALAYFSDHDLVNLVNAIFFYKLYPEQLFNEFIHPEKLVSVRTRLGVLHHLIEQLQKQLYTCAHQHGLNSGIDYFFHGDELPQGILIEVDEALKEPIQSAIRRITIPFNPENERQVTMDRLKDLGNAYKFWFNPNRLIDAVMVLRQRLVTTTGEAGLASFYQEMIILFGQFTTTQCLDLYGYFTNNDSRYLLYTFFTVAEGESLNWLPRLQEEEQQAIREVFDALQSVMEALRAELKNRHIATQAYVYDLEKQQIQARRRNREAVLRVITLYCRETVRVNETLESLFRALEEEVN